MSTARLGVFCLAQPAPSRSLSSSATAAIPSSSVHSVLTVPGIASPAPREDVGTVSRSRYPPLRLNRLSSETQVLSLDPPVYLLRDVLSPEDCLSIIDSIDSGHLTPVAYEQQVSVNTDRIKLLAPLMLLWAALPAASALSSGATGAEVVETAVGALVGASAAAAMLTAVVKTAVERVIGGQVFKGKKWDAKSANGEAAEAIDTALDKLEAVTGRSRRCFEPPLITRYLVGDQQRRHFDARIKGDHTFDEFTNNGLGQRLVQCVVYLNDMPEDGGGETKFHQPVMKGLAVPPSQGDCLVFFPAFSDGQADQRMEHSGEAVRKGSKYILNTWVCQNEC